MVCAVYIRMAFTRAGVSVGLTCIIKATAPATTGAAIEVPLKYITLLSAAVELPQAKVGAEAKILLPPPTFPFEAAPMILLPGATKSGLIKLSYRFAPLTIL